jgi:YHS domain-containing protein
MTRDPVCGKRLSAEQVEAVDRGTSVRATKRLHGDLWHYFCGLLCRARFTAHPDLYLEVKTSRE